MRKFFVYGTLLTGCSNHRVIDPKSIEKIEPATIDNMDLYIVKYGSFPCMIEGTGTVKGEVITIKDEYVDKATRRMDALEGYRKNESDSLYNRKYVQVTLEDGTKTKAHVYLFNNDRKIDMLGGKIYDGDFKAYMTRRKDSWIPNKY